jgi:hypothetical protein
MEDVRAILRAADGIIGAGGRSLLTKILRGSRSKDVLGHGLDKNPVYGFYRALSEADVFRRIDWAILHDYLRIEYDGKLPFLVYSPLGWKVERETFTDEIIGGFDTLLASAQRPYPVSFLKDMNRQLILQVLEKIEAGGDRKYLPVLEDWAQVDYKKVAQRISAVIQGMADGVAKLT